ncbi:MAG: hypothetical protein IID09_03385 [Candidatus Hydrogenedentes bacterium]|nr:hypothetical protein [Candidatus Hydrogenedentota bacterium]
MATAHQRDERYRRLPGRARRLFTLGDAERQHLWLGSDHILNVRTNWVTERHRRFQLGEIQTITVTGTNRGRNINFILGLLSAILTVMALYFLVGLADTGLAAVYGVGSAVLAALCAVLLVANLALGKTCVCRLYTAVQTEHLRALGRMRPARRFLEIVTPLIEAAQGEVSAEMLSLESLGAIEASQHARPTVERDGPKETKHAAGGAHMALFFMLILGAVDAFTLGLLSFPGRQLVDLMLVAVLFLTNIIALIKQSSSDLPYAVKALTWTSLAVVGFLVYSVSFALNFMAMLQGSGPFDIENVELPEGTWFRVLTAITGGTMLLFGALGLFDLMRFRRAYARLMRAETVADTQEDGAS